jgi:YaaC-like Protein
MVFVHRTYCLTYTSQKEMYLPLAQCGYVVDRSSNRIFFKADVAKDVSLQNALSRLPAAFVPDSSLGERAIRSARFVEWHNATRPTSSEVEDLVNLNRSLRRELHYIHGLEALWYMKARTPGPRRLERQLPTLVLLAMHRLSELCRYRPLQLALLLTGQKNWLLSEFIRLSADQFIDEIASELTGHKFLIPNVRSAV